MNREEEQKRIAKSQGIHISRPEVVGKPRNRIEAALQGNEFLPQLSKQPDRNEYREAGREEIKREREVSKNSAVLPERKKRRFGVKILFLIIVFCMLAASGVYGGLLIIRHVAQKAEVTTTETLLRDIGTLVELPSDEQPTIATVTDLKPLQNQPFFEKAAVGDKVLIFSKSKLAILYRPSEKRIIEFAPLMK